MQSNFVRTSTSLSKGSTDTLITVGTKPSAMEDDRSRSLVDQERKSIKCSSSRNTMNHKGTECCMCGDIGFQERLFRCHRCHHRFQHIYCSRLYSDQLELDGLNECDWCLDFQARQKRKVELQEMRSGKAKKVAACSQKISMLPSTTAIKQLRSVTIANSRKGNAKGVNFRVKTGGSNENQSLSLAEECKLSSESCRNVPHTPSQRSTTKGGLGRRYKLLSDVLCS